jgi:hypothetical protein
MTRTGLWLLALFVGAIALLIVGRWWRGSVERWWDEQARSERPADCRNIRYALPSAATVASLRSSPAPNSSIIITVFLCIATADYAPRRPPAARSPRATSALMSRISASAAHHVLPCPMTERTAPVRALGRRTVAARCTALGEAAWAGGQAGTLEQAVAQAPAPSPSCASGQALCPG